MEGYQLEAQNNADQTTADLSAARALAFDDYVNTSLELKDETTVDTTAVQAVLTALEVDGGSRMTDANIDAAVTAAKAAVKNDKALYAEDGTEVVDADGDTDYTTYKDVYLEGTSTYVFDTDGTYSDTGVLVGYVPVATPAIANKAEFDAAKVTTYSALALESRVKAADAAVANHEATAGEQADLLASIAEAGGAYLAQNPDIGTTAIEAYLTAYTAALDAADGDASEVELTDVATQLTALLTAGIDAEGESLLADNARGDALFDALSVQAKRAELETAAADAEDAFMAVPAGENQRTVEALQAERAEQIQDATDAQALITQLDDLIAAHADAEAEIAAILEDLGYDELVTLEADFHFADEAGVELFVFNLDQFSDDDGAVTLESVTINGLSAGDALFLNGYVQGEGTGDNNELEFFIEEVAGNTVVTVEGTPYAGAADENNVEITLTGITSAQLSIEGGLLSVAELAA